MRITRTGSGKWRVGNQTFSTRAKARAAAKLANRPKNNKVKKAVAGADRAFIFRYSDGVDNFTFESVARNADAALRNLREVAENEMIPGHVYWAIQFLTTDDLVN
jgi:hypothetical protein